MKDVMAKVSNVSRGGGIVDFTYSDVPVHESILLMNFEFEQLKNSLCDSFSGQTVDINTIFDNHNPGTDYILRNYRDALPSWIGSGKCGLLRERCELASSRLATTCA